LLTVLKHEYQSKQLKQQDKEKPGPRLQKKRKPPLLMQEVKEKPRPRLRKKRKPTMLKQAKRKSTPRMPK